MAWTREAPSPRYTELLDWSKAYHQSRKGFDGKRTFHAYPTIRTLAKQHLVSTLLDYGCGRGVQYKAADVEITPWLKITSIVDDLNLSAVHRYDPAVPEFADWPLPAGATVNMTVVVDALEYIPWDDLRDWVLPDIFRVTTDVVFINYGGGETTKVRNEQPRDPGAILRAVAEIANETEVDWTVRLQVRDADNWRIYRRASRTGWTLADLDQLYG